MDLEELVKTITEKVLDRLKAQDVPVVPQSKSPHALIIIDDSPFHNPKKNIGLIKDIHKTDQGAVVCAGSYHEQYIALERYGIEVIREQDISFYELVDRVKKVYILNFSISNGSKICAMVADNMVTRVVQYGLLTGKDIIVNPMDQGLNKDIINVNYLRKIQALHNSLGDLGIKLLQEGQLNSAPAGAVTDHQPYLSNTKRLITLERAYDIKSDTYEVNKNTIITPSALDYLRSKGINIVYRR
ncbi:MAG: hypothetical protein ACOYEJ_03480 [Mahellales bacterium]|jgi:hypothetical protein